MRFQRSAIFKPVDQMRRNKRRWEAYKKSILTKQSKQESKENLRINKSVGQSTKIKIQKGIWPILIERVPIIWVQRTNNGGVVFLPQQWRHMGEEPVISLCYEWDFPKIKVKIIIEEKILREMLD